MTKDKALKLALEALEQLQGGCTDHDDGTVEAITVWCPEVIDAIKEALAQPAQEPFAWCIDSENSGDWWDEDCVKTPPFPLYTTPQQRTWAGLTIYEMDDAFDESMKVRPKEASNAETRRLFAHAIEAKLRSKNT